MKGISIQFDNLVSFLQKNIKNEELLQSKDNFQIVYEKVTQQTLKTVQVILQNLSDDLSVKQSYSKLLKQIKTFLSLKPSSPQEDEDEYFDDQFDLVKQFMNSRKPVMPQLDSGQRGDIYKYLYQAENKQKDIQQFIGNVNKFNPRHNKKMEMTTHKWKKTHVQLPPITEDIYTQTDLSMSILQTLQTHFPTLFKSPTSANQSQDQNNHQNQSNLTENLNDFQARIQQLINQKVQQKTKVLQEKKANQIKDKQNAEKKKQSQNKNKKPNLSSNKKNSEVNVKRNSNPNTLTKSQSQSQYSNKKLNVTSEVKQKNLLQSNQKNSNDLKKESPQQRNNINPRSQGKQLQMINEESSKAQDNENNDMVKKLQIGDNDQSIIEKKQKDEFVNKMKQNIPTFENFLQNISEDKKFDTVSKDELKAIYQAMKSQFVKNLSQNQDFSILSSMNSNKPTDINDASSNNPNNQNLNSANKTIKTTQQKSVNTDSAYFENVTNYANNQLQNMDSNSKLFSKKTNIYQGQNNQLSSNCKQEYQSQPFQNNLDQNNNSIRNNQNKLTIGFGQNQKKDQFSSQINQVQQSKNLQTLKFQNQSSYFKNALPHISKASDNQNINNLKRNDSTNLLAKQGKTADEYLKKMKDSKFIGPIQTGKVFNKQNYTLDMYKPKDISPKNRMSQHINLPSLNRNASKGNFTSLHEQIEGSLESPNLKRSMKKGGHNTTIDPSSFLQKQEGSMHESRLRRGKKDKLKNEFKEQQMIMSELEKMSNEGTVKYNLKNIAMLINRVESIHLKRCGQKCIHLERFYGFLQRNNLPNRRELLMHKADMNEHFIRQFMPK